MIDGGERLTVKRQCELLALNRTGVYYTPRAVSEWDLRLMRRIDELHLEHPYYGARRLAKQLAREGFEVGRLHVATLMRRMGIEAIYRKPRTSIPARQASIYPYLLGGLVIERPDQVWASDITYIPMAHGFLYWVAILDVASRKVLSFRLSKLTLQLIPSASQLPAEWTTLASRASAPLIAPAPTTRRCRSVHRAVRAWATDTPSSTTG